MRYLLLSIGTRGDMEPFLAIGQLLQTQGHEVHCAMPAQFGALVEDAGFVFHPLDRRFMALIEGAAGRAIMGQQGNRLSRIVQLFRLSLSSMSIQKNILAEQREYIQSLQPDQIVYHPKCIYGRVWAMQHPTRASLISPIPCWLHPVKAYPHIAITWPMREKNNLRSYRIINGITAYMTSRFTRRYANDFPEITLHKRTILTFMQQQERTLYTVSPSLFQRPDYWPESAQVIGYLERKKTTNWQPSAELVDFIEANQNKAAGITFITFGSMVNANPARTTRIILSVLAQRKIPAIINTSSGGLVRPADAANYHEHIHFVSDVPYEWVFPRVQSVVHHGGSGTTHTALKHGCASLIFPHIVDQFFWNRLNHQLGAGPLGVKIKKLTEASFSSLLLDLRTRESYRAAARELSLRMQAESTVTERELLAVLDANSDTEIG
ncbi:MAG: glycosyltransferase [Bacteroidota bacterium]